MECTFKVGDRIRPTQSFAPDATVTEITERGFKYVYDEVWHVHPRLGISFSGGEEYLDVHPEIIRWTLINDDNSKKPTTPFLFCVSG